jgi:CubicO group peptidase (beta-lactamase class C family)
MNRRELLVGSGLAAIAAAAPVSSRAAPGAPAIGAIEAGIARRLKAGVPAITAGFVHRGRRWAKGFGLADVENGTPASAATAYRFASVQKAMTAVAVLQLAEAGALDLDGDIRGLVPYFPAKPWSITPRQLLGHQGGIRHYVNRAVEQHFTDHKDTRAAVALFAAFDLVAEPGTRFSYSSYGYNLLGAAIEGASGQSYADYMRDHIWRPAGMTATRLDDPLAIIPHRARGYQLIDGALRNSEFVDVSSRFAAGGTRGTVPDLLGFMAALNDGLLLPPSRIAELHAPMRTRGGGFSGFPGTEGYAMGWNVLRADGRLVLQNDGGQQETRTMIVNVPDEKLCIATAQNLEKDDDGLPLAFEIYEAVLGRRFPLPSS